MSTITPIESHLLFNFRRPRLTTRCLKHEVYVIRRPKIFLQSVSAANYQRHTALPSMICAVYTRMRGYDWAHLPRQVDRGGEFLSTAVEELCLELVFRDAVAGSGEMGSEEINNPELLPPMEE